METAMGQNHTFYSIEKYYFKEHMQIPVSLPFFSLPILPISQLIQLNPFLTISLENNQTNEKPNKPE